MHDVVDDRAIRNLVARFANSLDLKAWEILGDCLTETFYADYSALRGTPPEVMSRARFVDLRQTALQELRTHHLTGNIEISLHGESAAVVASMIIYRQGADEQELTSHCVYTLGTTKVNGAWRISSIVQSVLWSKGNTAIHAGIALQR